MTQATPARDLNRWTAALLLILGVAGFYWKLVLTGEYSWMNGDDAAFQVLPWLQFQAGEWHAGRFPLWDPNHWAGQPLIGQAQPGAAYPLNWILFLTPLREGWLKQFYLHWYFVTIHLMAAWFAYKLARELGCRRMASACGGLIFSLAGWMGNTEWPQMINGGVWAPLVLLYLLRVLRGKAAVASAGLGGFFLGVAWLSGHHQIPMFVSVTCLGIWLWALASRRSGLAPFAVFWTMTVCAGALQLLPAQEYGRLAIRWVGAPEPIGWNQKVPYDVHRTYSLNPMSLLGIMFPGLTTHPEPFLGVAALSLVLLSLAAAWRRLEVRVLAAIALFGLLYSFAQHGLIHGVLYSLAPHLDKARSASAAIFLLGLAGSMLAAVGLNALLDGERGLWLKRIALAAIGLGAFILGVRGTLILMHGWPGSHDPRRMLTGAVALLLGLLLWGLGRGFVNVRVVGFLLPALFLFEASRVSMYFSPRLSERDRTAGLRSLSEHADIAAFLRKQPGLPRIDVDDRLVHYNFGDWYGLPQTGGYLASLSENTYRHEFHTAWAKRLLGVAFAIGKSPTELHRREVFTGSSGLKVYANPDVLPRVFTVHQAFQIPDRMQAAGQLYLMRDELQRKTFLLTSPPRLEQCAGMDNVRILTYDPSRVRISATMACQGMVILTDTWFPGWEAQVDGRPAPIEEAYALVRGIVVPAGEHVIELRYRPRSVIAGGILSGFSLLAAIWFLISSRRQSRSSPIRLH